MKYDLQQTIEQIEDDYWGEPVYDSRLVRTCHQLRKKPLVDFIIEDLRILIGQNGSLIILIPIALEKLQENILAEGDLYEGDLLTAVLNSDPQYWDENKDHWQSLCETFERNKALLLGFDTLEEIRKNWFKSYQLFKKIHEANVR